MNSDLGREGELDTNTGTLVGAELDASLLASSICVLTPFNLFRTFTSGQIRLDRHKKDSCGERDGRNDEDTRETGGHGKASMTVPDEPLNFDAFLISDLGQLIVDTGEYAIEFGKGASTREDSFDGLCSNRIVL